MCDTFIVSLYSAVGREGIENSHNAQTGKGPQCSSIFTFY